MSQTNFLDALHKEDMSIAVEHWRIPELPDLSRFDEIFVDLETNGLRWYDSDRMIGAGILTPDGVSRYLPVRHLVGPNIEWETFRRWAQRELRGKRIVNIRTKFDAHMFRADGIDLEAQGCTFGDVAHYAALLDDHRRRFNQHDLARDFLGVDGDDAKVVRAYGFELDPKRFAEYPAGLVAPRAEGDVRTVAALQAAMWPRLDAQDLQRVRALEDAVIPVVVEMEHNGAPLDTDLLADWCTRAQAQLDQAMFEIQRDTGVKLESPTKRSDLMRLFAVLHVTVPIGVDFKTGESTDEPSFADDLLAPIMNAQVQKLRFCIQLASLLSKFLLKYQHSTARDGILRYELHQLPYQNDEGGGGGAVSGRFSSAAPSKDEGANIQQVFGVKAQQESLVKEFIVKKLFKPDRREHPNAVWCKADASQFQFRLFAHYANAPALIKAYQRDNDWRGIQARAMEKIAAGLALTKDDKLTDYHEMVQELIKEVAGKELNRTHTKNVNFAQVFAAGIRKMASQLGVPSEEIPNRNEPLTEGGPRFQQVVQISNTYHSMFPEVKPLLALTSHLAMPGHKMPDRNGRYGCGETCRELCAQGYQHRGWVRTIDGRRARFGPHDRHYSALNRVIQGTEGDVNKRVLVAAHKQRHSLGLTMRFTVHDELDTDLHEPGLLPAFREMLNTQYYDFKVPILWEAGIGPSWAEAK